VGATVIPSFLMNAARHRISAQANAVIGTLRPIATIALTAAILGEVMTGMEWLGAAGGGLVTATLNGQFEVVRVKIDKSVVDPNDVGMLEDLVTAAINAAAKKVRETSQEKMAAVMGPMAGMPGMPGMF
jgi:DNA-binding YbaB/EbfC family protein